MRTWIAILALALAQTPAPANSEIFLATLSARDGALAVGAPENISNSAGYDNQPCFTPDGGAILFTSDRSRIVSAPVEGAPPATPRTDIYRYDIAARRVVQVTDTREGEFSPTVTPDGRGISVIRVEQDGTQRLWRFTLDGGEPGLVLEQVKPVGYHAWIDEHRLALFILGARGEPATLQLADVRTGRAERIATDIGRSVQRMPSGQISFVQRSPQADGRPPAVTIARFDASAAGDARIQPLTAPVPGATQPDVAWMPDGTLLMAQESRLYRWKTGDTAWSLVADLAAAGLRNISRLAVNPSGDRLALVAEVAR
jgi:hypothetical protein